MQEITHTLKTDFLFSQSNTAYPSAKQSLLYSVPYYTVYPLHSYYSKKKANAQVHKAYTGARKTNMACAAGRTAAVLMYVFSYTACFSHLKRKGASFIIKLGENV